jgi:hypothetical protein
MAAGYAKLNFWVIGEGYVIIIVASMPLLNSLVRWGKQKTQHSYERSKYINNQVTIEQPWAKGHEQPWAKGHEQQTYGNSKYNGNQVTMEQAWPLPNEGQAYGREWDYRGMN